jgi:hypothetical protein
VSTSDSTTGITGDRGRGRGRRPRNYLAGAERHRLFLRVVPPALVVLLLAGWVERSWFGRVPEPVPAQVDTVLAKIPAEPSVVDGVRIAGDVPAGESDRGLPTPAGPSAGDDPVGASVAALARVRDDTLFRSDDEPAWSELCRSLVGMPTWPPAGRSVREVSFADLHGQSRALRGHLVGFQGVVRRLVPVDPLADRGIDQPRWQGWIEPDHGPASPIVVYFLRLPEGMPHAITMAERVDVQGYFFKRWAYQATDAIRTAPLVLSLEPRWHPREPIAPGGHRWGGWGIVAITSLMAATWVGLQVAGRAPRRARELPPAPWDGLVDSPPGVPRFDLVPEPEPEPAAPRGEGERGR